jgi:hypothetical protein
MFIVISIAVFVVVALAVFVGASLLDERSSKARLLRERLSTVQKAGEREPNQELALLRDEVMSKIPALDNLLRRSSSISNFQTLLEQADVKSRAGNVLLLCLLSGALGLIVLLFSGFPYLPGWPSHRRVSALLLRQLQKDQALRKIRGDISRGDRHPGPRGSRRSRLHHGPGTDCQRDCRAGGFRVSQVV